MDKEDIQLLAKAIAQKEPLSERIGLIEKLLTDLDWYIHKDPKAKTQNYIA
jgi:hypothetical protein